MHVVFRKDTHGVQAAVAVDDLLQLSHQSHARSPSCPINVIILLLESCEFMMIRRPFLVLSFSLISTPPFFSPRVPVDRSAVEQAAFLSSVTGS